MTDSIRLGRIAGIKVGLHWSVAIFGLFIAWNLSQFFFPEFAPGHTSTTYFAVSLLGAAALGASILAHELGHATVAVRRGVGIDGITLWVMGGVARMTSEPRTPRHAFEIAAAGPAVSVVAAVATGIVAGVGSAAGLGALSVWFFGWLALVNGALALFNLIPALPLDGGRILHAWKWHRGGDREIATVRAAKLGRAFGRAMFVLAAFQLWTDSGNGLWTGLLGLFVISQANADRRRAEHRIAMRNRPTTAPLLSLLRLFGGPVGHPRPASVGGFGPIGSPPRSPTAGPDSGAKPEVIDLIRLDRTDTA